MALSMVLPATSRAETFPSYGDSNVLYRETFPDIPFAGEIPAGWSLYSPAGTKAEAKVTDQAAASQPYSMAIRVVAGNGQCSVHKPVAYEGRRACLIEFKANSDSPIARFSVNKPGVAGFWQSTPIGVTDGWQAFSVRLDRDANGDADTLRLSFVTGGETRSLLIDDVVVRSLPGTEAPVGAVDPKRRSLNPVVFAQPEGTSSVWIVQGGKPRSSLFMDRHNVSSQEVAVLTMAAEELCYYIEKATGVALPIVEELPAEGNVIALGGKMLARTIGLDPDGMARESFTLKTAPKRVFIVGDDTIATGIGGLIGGGALWGACDFLERYLGVRWYYPGDMGTIIPETRDLKIDPVCYSDHPEFGKRVIYRFHGYPVPGGGDRLPQFGAKLTYAHFRVADSSGMVTPCHTPHGWAKVYGESNPDYFQMGADGQRTPPMWCYSNPEVLRQLVADLERFYQSGMEWDEPWSGSQKPMQDMIPISPIDMPVDCYCPACRALTRKDSPLGQSSQVMGPFIERLCQEVKKRWPDKTVCFLPYMNYTLPPEGIEYADNLAVSMCWMRTLANQKEPEIAAAEFAIRDGWRRITKRPMGHWIYTCWPSDCTKAPFQYPHVMKEYFTKTRGDVGFFCDAGVDWARKHLTLYLMGRLMWNPDFDVDAAIAEYHKLMYGPAATTMARVFSTLTDGWEQSRWKPPLPTYHQISLANVHVETYPQPVVEKLKALMDKALADVEKDSIEHRRIAFFKTAMDPFFEESARFHEGGAKRELQVLRIGSMPKLDGLLDEEFWKLTPEVEFVTLDKDKPVPRFPTAVKAAWIPDKGVVFGVQMTEPDPEGIRRQRTVRDELIYMDDCVEIFLDPWAEYNRFFQIVVNFDGALYDALYHSLGKAWDSEGVVSHSHVGDGSWSMEIFIPFDTLQAKGVKTGTIWFGNLTRSRWRSEDQGGNELSRFSTSYDLKKLNTNLNTLNFGQLRFIE